MIDENSSPMEVTLYALDLAICQKESELDSLRRARDVIRTTPEGKSWVTELDRESRPDVSLGKAEKLCPERSCVLAAGHIGPCRDIQGDPVLPVRTIGREGAPDLPKEYQDQEERFDMKAGG